MKLMQNGRMLTGLGVSFEAADGEGGEGGGGEGGGTGTATRESGAGEGAGAGGEGEVGDGEGAGGGEGGAGGDEGGNKEKVGKRADNRFQQLANSNKQLQAQLQQVLKENADLKTPQEQRAGLERRRELAKKFYQDPHGYVEALREELRQEHQAQQAGAQDLGEYRAGLGALKASPGWSLELEKSMVAVLERYGLTDQAELMKFGRTKALKLAYEAATGKEWGQWTQDGYNTRKTKERLSRPGSGGAGNSWGKLISPDEYDRQMNELARKVMDPDEQSQTMEKLSAGLDAWYAANAG